uniref:BESS domain-containing protein n=1 Tax=Glossina pallidipes TaxID=7398 RepID=A0A1A9ZFG5_GLOPL
MSRILPTTAKKEDGNDIKQGEKNLFLNKATNTDHTASTALNGRKTGEVSQKGKKPSEKVTNAESKKLPTSSHKNGERKRISGDNKDSTILNNSRKGEGRKLLGRIIVIGSTQSSTSSHSKKGEGKNVSRETNNTVNNLSLSSSDYKKEKRKRVLEKVATTAHKVFPASSESRKTFADKVTATDRKDYLASSDSKNGKTKSLSDKATSATSNESRRSSSSSDFKDIATSNDSINPSNAIVERQLTDTKEDSTENFLLAFAPIIEGLSSNQKWRARVKIAKIIHEMESEQSSTILNIHFGPFHIISIYLQIFDLLFSHAQFMADKAGRKDTREGERSKVSSKLAETDYKNVATPSKSSKVEEKIKTRKSVPADSKKAEEKVNLQKSDSIVIKNGDENTKSEKSTTGDSQDAPIANVKSLSSVHFQDISTSEESIIAPVASFDQVSTDEFLLSFAPVIESLSSSQRLRALAQISEILREIEIEEQ